MIKYNVFVYNEKKCGNELIVTKVFYNADEVDAYAREMSLDFDWVRVVDSESNLSTIYVDGKIKY